MDRNSQNLDDLFNLSFLDLRVSSKANLEVLEGLEERNKLISLIYS
jgi:hypothetical protein